MPSYYYNFQITSDPRMKLEAKLRAAGLHQSDYALYFKIAG
jgi:hypothetical protein